MDNSEWVDTKREYETTSAGDLILKKVTKELDKKTWYTKHKDKVDFYFRILGILSIIIPVIIFFSQRNAEARKQRAIYQSDVYSNLAVNLHSLIRTTKDSHEFDLVQSKILNETYPKIVLLNEREIIDTFQIMKIAIEHVAVAKEEEQLCDSLLSFLSDDFPQIDYNDPLFNDLRKHYWLQISGTISRFADKLYSNNKSFEALKTDTTLKIYKYYDSLIKENWLTKTGLWVDVLTLKKEYWEYLFRNESMDRKIWVDIKEAIQKLGSKNYNLKMTYDSLLPIYTRKLDSMMIKSSAILYNR